LKTLKTTDNNLLKNNSIEVKGNNETISRKIYTIQIIDENTEIKNVDSESDKSSDDKAIKSFIHSSLASELESLSRKPSLKITRNNLTIGNYLSADQKSDSDKVANEKLSLVQNKFTEKISKNPEESKTINKNGLTADFNNEQLKSENQKPETKTNIKNSVGYSDVTTKINVASEKVNDETVKVQNGNLIIENKKTDTENVDVRHSAKAESTKELADHVLASDRKDNNNNYSGESNDKGHAKENSGKTNVHFATEAKATFGEAVDKGFLRASTDNRQSSMNESIRTIQNYELQDELKKIMQSNESKNVTLKLNPESLGKVNVSIDMTDNIMNTKINVESESVKQLIQSSSESLKNMLNENGIQLASFTVNLTNADEKGNNRYVIKAKRRNSNSSEKFSVENNTVEIKHKNFGYNTYDYIM
jgi:flagellar hook-length control protein FliK